MSRQGAAASIPDVDELQVELAIDRINAANIHSLLRLAHARGVAGRWPDQAFEAAHDWARDGFLIDRVALLADVQPVAVLELYTGAHRIGLKARGCG